MHGDTRSSDTTPLAGPGVGNITYHSRAFISACPTVLVRTDGNPMALCTAYLDRSPVIRILNKDNGFSMANLKLNSGTLLGGVYAYLDSQDRLVMVDGKNDLIRIRADLVSGPLGKNWDLTIDSKVSLVSAITKYCGSPSCDGVVSLSVDEDSAIWFVSQQSVVGVLDTETGNISTVKLAENELIHNSFSTASGRRAAIATDRALYLLKKDELGNPVIKWRHTYNAGTHRKPGQLSHGTGATPTFFGPNTGTEYVTISDNADNLISLIVRDATTVEGKLICQQRLFDKNSSGTENSAIGVGNTVIVASTYGYPYPAVPKGAGKAIPETADFVGGMIRVDVREDKSGCDVIWKNAVRSSAVPKLSTSDQLIYTVERKHILGKYKTTNMDSFHFTVIDPNTGMTLSQNFIGAGLFQDTLQTAGNAGEGGIYWQGTTSGVTRIESRK
ncbi:hypothetical protein ORQ98_28950 [Spartinivicinus sp. A2-2]|uniref:Uncharacterized protein n=2 Tax=Spartinivicinus poritis TaxID=2994640 RepID=A0ABT5UHX4_9GAMM|nr:hypothetical protein [Spartinivicinus sp. A2-2]